MDDRALTLSLALRRCPCVGSAAASLALVFLGGLGGAFCCAADPVLDWANLMVAAIRLEDTAPTLATRNLAILHAALYDAVNSIERTHQPYQFDLNPPSNALSEAAATAAAYQVMQNLFPSTLAEAEDLYTNYVAAQPVSTALSNSLAFGATIGQMAVEARAGDGATTDLPYIPSDAPGQWRRTPPFFRPPLDPQWRYVQPFCLPDIEPFVPPGPPSLTSDQYALDFNQVKALGAHDHSTRTPEQTQIAIFWSDFSYTATPPGHWEEIAIAIARNQGNTLAQNARLFALLSFAQADSGIACWEAKYRYNSWRPITAIQRADEAGNPATLQDTNWTSLLVAPNFPEYTSGHSTFSKASSTILSLFYGTDSLSFAAASDALPGVFRNFNSLAACTDEISMSRIYAGIHFPSATRDGKTCGARVADYIFHNSLLANDQLPRLTAEGAADGLLTLRLHAHLGRSMVLEASSDLRNWSALSTNAAALGGVAVQQPQTAVPARQFYRLREF